MPIDFEDQIGPGYAGNYTTDAADSLVHPDHLIHATDGRTGLLTADLLSQLRAGSDFQGISIATAERYNNDLDAQLASNQPLMAVITGDMTGTRGASTFTWKNGDVLTFAPRSDSPEHWFNIKSSIPANVPDGAITPPNTVTKGLFTQDIYDFLAARDKWVSHGVSTAAQLHQILTDSAQMKLARLLVFEDDINEAHQSITYVHKRNLVGYALPGETSVTDLFRLTDTKIKHAGTASELTALLAQHVTENTDLFVFINAGFRHSGTNYAKWSLVSFKPESVAPVVELNLARPSTSIRIEPPSIAAPADLDGNYVLFLGDLPYSNAEVDQLDIWIKDEGVHTVSPFTPESGPFVIPFEVSTAEETQIALTNADDYARVLAVYRKGGQYVGQDTTVLAVKGQVPTGTGGLDLTNQQKAELIDVRVTPSVVTPSDTAFKTFMIRSDDPSILGASVWANTLIAGQRTSRVRLTGLGAVTVTYSDIVAETINQNITDDQLVVTADVELWDAESGGNELASLNRDITLSRGGGRGPAGPAGPEGPEGPQGDPGRDGTGIISSHAPVAPTDANADDILYRGKIIHTNEEIAKTATFRDLEIDDIKTLWPAATAWGGVITGFPNLAAGTWVYRADRNQFARSAGNGGYETATTPQGLAAVWPLDNSHRVVDEGHAVDQASANGQWFSWGAVMKVVTAVGDPTHREWVPYNAPPQWMQELTTAAATIAIGNTGEVTIQTLRITPRSAETRVNLRCHVDATARAGPDRNDRDLGVEVRLYRGTNLLLSRHKRGTNYATGETVHQSLDLDLLDAPASAEEQTYTLRAVRLGYAGGSSDRGIWSLTDRQIIAHEVL